MADLIFKHFVPVLVLGSGSGSGLRCLSHKLDQSILLQLPSIQTLEQICLMVLEMISHFISSVLRSPRTIICNVSSLPTGKKWLTINVQSILINHRAYSPLHCSKRDETSGFGRHSLRIILEWVNCVTANRVLVSLTQRVTLEHKHTEQRLQLASWINPKKSQNNGFLCLVD